MGEQVKEVGEVDGTYFVIAHAFKISGIVFNGGWGVTGFTKDLVILV